ncbi:hypothetical protein MGSAQ_001342 [marine sediment metagenome]|uniref:Uncharacterized protein n=1 Tax=marine sediment metagenome TaxID=412755 RepID=A0A1B6NUX3_9ZZZZ
MKFISSQKFPVPFLQTTPLYPSKLVFRMCTYALFLLS